MRSVDLVFVYFIRHIFQDKITISIGKGDLQVGLNVESSTSACVLLWSGVDRSVERRHAVCRSRGCKLLGCRKTLSPVDRLYLPLIINAKDVRNVTTVQAEKHWCPDGIARRANAFCDEIKTKRADTRTAELRMLF